MTSPLRPRQSAPSPSRSSCQYNPANAASPPVPAASQSAVTLASVDSSSSPALMSPVTPGETIPDRSAEPSLPTAFVAAQGPGLAPPPSLPSPALSSHNASPASALGGKAQELSCAAPSTSPPGVPAAEPSSVNNNAVAVPALSPPQPLPNAAPMPSPGIPADRSEETIDERIWSSFLMCLNTFLNTPGVASTMSGNGDLPRAHLLREACIDHDLLYLALHQVYCLHTCDPAKLDALGFTPASIHGFHVIQRLLLRNSTLSPTFLDWSVNFPFNSQKLCHPEYKVALDLASQSLARFSERWEHFCQDIQRRGYPPLIEEMVYQFQVTSSVLLMVIFLSMCRLIYGSINEASLRRIFLQDKQNYQRRFDQPPISPEQMQQRSDMIIQQYQAIRAQLAASGSPPVGVQNAAPLPTRRPARHSFQANHAVPTRVMTRASRLQGAAPSQTFHPVQAFEDALAPMPSLLPPIQTWQAQAPVVSQTISAPAATAYHPPTTTRPAALSASPGPAQGRAITQHHPSAEPRNMDWQGTQQSPTIPLERRPQAPQPQTPRYPMFLPPPGHVPPIVVRPNPLRLALHQAHLRDPVKKLIRRSPGGDEEVELFQYMSSFVVPPTPLGQIESAFNWKFPLPSTDTQRFPRRVETGAGRRALRIFTEGGRVYYLRCVKVSPAVKEVGQREWSVADTSWPSVIYVFVNGEEHFVRRKVHHGKDLPLDITDSLREGENEVSFHFVRSAAECRDTLYALGVEAMDISNYDQVRQLVKFLPAADTDLRIRKQLSSDGADDELSIVNDDIAVDLLDPFTARVFDTPARGSICRHLECFDLKMFLATRASKSGNGPMEWDWRCPICREDARPQTLVIDGYLDNVRAHLALNNQLDDAKKIYIKADGSWELRVEQDTQTPEREKGRDRTPGTIQPRRKRDDDSNGSPGVRRPPQRLKTGDSSRLERGPAQMAEVIELE